MEKTAPQLTSHGSCHACTYCGSRVTPGSKTITFVCRFNPPAVQVIGLNQQGIQVAVLWAEVSVDDWCGKFVAQGH